MAEQIYLSPPDVTELESDALLRAFNSGWIAPLGPEVDAFETELAHYTGRRFAVALSSGTAALHLGLLTLGVRPGATVVTSSLTFAATANAITYTGAEPVFVDCDLSGNMDPQLLSEALTILDREGRLPAAILPVDVLGKVANYDAICSMAQKYAIPVLADAAESIGAVRGDKPAGSFADAAAISFNGNKVMTTSGGGALLTDNEQQAALVRHLATQAREPAAHYEHHRIGYNYRLSNLLAALGRAQLSRLDSMIDRRKKIWARYIEFFESVRGIDVFGEPSAMANEGTHDNCWLTSVVLDPLKTPLSPNSLAQHLANNRIEARPLWKPMHLQPVFQTMRSFETGTSEALFKNGLSLPSGSVLSDEALDSVFDALREALTTAST